MKNQNLFQKPISLTNYEDFTIKELREIAKNKDLVNYIKLSKEDLINTLYEIDLFIKNGSVVNFSLLEKFKVVKLKKIASKYKISNFNRLKKWN